MKLIFTVLFTILTLFTSCNQDPGSSKPNVVIIFLDDSGWADFEPFGEVVLETPNVTQLASEGTAFHNFYVPQAVCSASRSALLSGCFPGRTKVFGAHGPNAWGLDTTFATMGEVFKRAGYATAAFGKWHCGDQPETRSYARGFDETCGLMYSNDMWKHHPEAPEYWGQWPLKYWENGEVTIEEVDHADQKNLTRWYTEHAVDFIERHQDGPFLLYVPHSMPHVPLYCSDEFEGKSGKGLYWDVMLEIDWSVGQINQALKDRGIDDNTIVILTSDNGPWISYGDHAGITPYREAKGTSFDGGVRSACIMKYPGGIKAGTICERTFGTVDLLPTLCHLAGIALPENEIDGKNVWDLITGTEGALNPHEYYAFSNGDNFEGVMSGDGNWKLHLPHGYRTLESAGTGGMAGKYGVGEIDTALFNMKADPYETTNVLKDHPEVAEKLISLAEAHKLRFYSE
ncbi:MAG: arylsulfatase [Bacteroidia bacterium]|nr:MAG: arylsulfatase [Bacteroidia bacterium]